MRVLAPTRPKELIHLLLMQERFLHRVPIHGCHHQFTTEVSGGQRGVSISSRVQPASSTTLLAACICTGRTACHETWDSPILPHPGRCRPSTSRSWPNELLANLSRRYCTCTVWLRDYHGIWIWIWVGHAADHGSFGGGKARHASVSAYLTRTKAS